MREIFLLTRLDDGSRVGFTLEEDISKSLEITYSQMSGRVITKLNRLLYTVKYTRADVVNEDVFTVQRVTVYEAPAHL